MTRATLVLVLSLLLFQSPVFCSSVLWENEALGAMRRFVPSVMRCFPISLSQHVNPIRFYSDSSRKKPVRISHPCIDGVFQHGFAEPSILSDFLNAVLNLKNDQTIQDIEYLPRDLPPPNPVSDLGYHFTVDVRCFTRSGQHFLVEMQNDFRDDYHLKALVEHSRMISRLDLDQKPVDKDQRSETSKGSKRKFWTGIQGIYSVVITNKLFSLKRMKDIYSDEPVMEPFLVNPYELRHVNMPDRHYGNIPHQIVLLMLANLNKKETELSTPIERWSYLFKDTALGSGSVKIPEAKDIEDPDLIAGPDQAIKNFIERVKEENIPFEVRDHYLRHVRYFNDCILDIESRGAERGVNEEKRRMAKALIADGDNDDKIARITKLSIDQIKDLRKSC